jgi:hypothetical protein
MPVGPGITCHEIVTFCKSAPDLVVFIFLSPAKTRRIFINVFALRVRAVVESRSRSAHLFGAFGQLFDAALFGSAAQRGWEV